MASCIIGSGTDGLATHHKAPLGAIRLGGGGTDGGGYTIGGSNTVGLGTLPPPLGEGFGVDPGGPGRIIGGFCMGSGEFGTEPSFGDGIVDPGGFCIGSGEPGPVPPLGDGNPGGPGRIIGGFCIGSGEPGPVPPLFGDGMDPGGPGRMMGGFCIGSGASGPVGGFGVDPGEVGMLPTGPG